ncbi:hypothetical protein HPB48_017887 [Haemaphysalis longicornis]|uniref:CCDC92/74 N-terminal domain-containing protein n=1 Tax=Haemaphysalis longicornis TaxID=44386 RepID=A0A9J6GRT7_HAELO|nr:hypothetical protein HPB48_017887 [Haemaphysalis longicornis]
MCAAASVVVGGGGENRPGSRSHGCHVVVRRSPPTGNDPTGAVGLASGASRLPALVSDDPKTLQAQLRSARNDLVFLQNQHRLTLRGLHAEIAKLQKTVKESYKAKIGQLEEELEKWCCHCRFLSSQLEHANNALVSLNQRLQVQDWQHQAEMSEKNSIIANLQRELEWKCRALAELEMASRGRGNMARRASGPLAASMTTSSSLVEPALPGPRRTPPHKGSGIAACEKASAVVTSTLRKSSHRLPLIVRDRPTDDDDDDYVAAQSSQPSTAASRGATPRRASHSGARAVSAKCLPVAGLLNGQQKETTACGSQRRDRPEAPAAASPASPRSLVHHQLTAVHCDSGLSTDEELSIDRVPSPELKPKKLGNRTLEVSTK